MIARQIRNKARERRLRIEILETRSMLTAAPWSFVVSDELPWETEHTTTGEKFNATEHRREPHAGGRGRGLGSRGPDHQHGRSDPGRLRPPRSNSAIDPHWSRGGAPSSAKQLALPIPIAPQAEPHSLYAASQTVVQHNRLQANDQSQARSTGDVVIFEPPRSLGSADHIYRAELVPLSHGAQVVVIAYELAFNPVPHRGETTRPTQSREISSGPGSDNPMELHKQVQADMDSFVWQEEIATPTWQEAGVTAFEFDRPSLTVDPAQTFEGPFPAFRPGAVSGLQPDNPVTDGGRSFDFALDNLFLDLDRLGSLHELDNLLHSLVEEQGNATRADKVQASDDRTGRWLPRSNMVTDLEHPSSETGKYTRKHHDTAGGMIALQLPDDLLIASSELLDRELRDQPSAWTARIGLYRAHELGSANAGSAIKCGPANAHMSRDLSERQQLGDSIVASRLRPVIAATSAAFGAILVSLRKRRRRLACLSKHTHHGCRRGASTTMLRAESPAG